VDDELEKEHLNTIPKEEDRIIHWWKRKIVD
jgi:hypothetical protein